MYDAELKGYRAEIVPKEHLIVVRVNCYKFKRVKEKGLMRIRAMVGRCGVCFLVVLSFLAVGNVLKAQTGPAKDNKAVMTDRFWGVELQFDGYKDWTDHPFYGRPNFVFAGTSTLGSCQVSLSMFAEVVKPGMTAHECRKDYPADPEKLKTRSDVSQIEERKTPITYSLFDEHGVFKGSPYVRKQLYGYWTRNDICFELHVSSSDCADFRKLALSILESVRLSPDNGATHETVAVARKTGQLPGDWKVHMQVATIYLYSNPPVPSRARLFYQSALDRAGAELDPRNRWSIEEGIALAWLGENNGEKALPHLIRALEVTDKDFMDPYARSETFQNTACAYALKGETQRACNALTEALSAVPPNDKERTLEAIRTDDQLTSIRSSQCYQSLMKGKQGSVDR